MAATSLFLATLPDPTPFHGAHVLGRQVARTDPTMLDDDLAERLWSESIRLVGFLPMT